jgi:hypothetical protein
MAPSPLLLKLLDYTGGSHNLNLYGIGDRKVASFRLSYQHKLYTIPPADQAAAYGRTAPVSGR